MKSMPGGPANILRRNLPFVTPKPAESRASSLLRIVPPGWSTISPRSPSEARRRANAVGPGFGLLRWRLIRFGLWWPVQSLMVLAREARGRGIPDYLALSPGRQTGRKPRSITAKPCLHWSGSIRGRSIRPASPVALWCWWPHVGDTRDECRVDLCSGVA